MYKRQVCGRVAREAVAALHAARRLSLSGNGRRACHGEGSETVSYTHLRAHETVLDLVCRLLLEKKKQKQRQETLVCKKDTT